MGDVITRKAVLHKSGRADVADRLYVATTQHDWRDIPVWPAPHVGGGWSYVANDTKLFVTPSLHCTDTGFHTDFNWVVDYELLPDGAEPVQFFRSINPDWELA